MHVTIDFSLIVEQCQIEHSSIVSNALIHMFSKCGRIDKARSEFNRLSDSKRISLANRKHLCLLTSIGKFPLLLPVDVGSLSNHINAGVFLCVYIPIIYCY